MLSCSVCPQDGASAKGLTSNKAGFSRGLVVSHVVMLPCLVNIKYIYYTTVILVKTETGLAIQDDSNS